MYRTSLLAILALTAVTACKNDIQVAETPNVAPGVNINAPSDGAAVNAGQNVEFVGVVGDENGLDDIATVTWTSSIDGEIGGADTASPDPEGVTRVTSVLSPGVHAITLTATDLAGDSGEETISVSVGTLDQDPVVAINSPEVFSTYFIGEAVDLVGAASDEQDDPQDLAIEWTAEMAGSSSPVTIYTGHPDASGIVTGSWSAEQGNWILTLIATDSDGNTGEEQVAISVTNADGADLDGDGFSPLNGDCNDNDPEIHPNADEICGDALDNDCNGAVDDKDSDNDQHVDSACVNYTGTLPIDDCNDDDSFIYPGAGELQDGDDNDCDGFVDEDTPAFDDDGDCFCEVGPCVDSVEPTCVDLLEGDCDDTDAALNPDGSDIPDPDYDDGNCDGIDGDIADMVFVDPQGGNNGNDGLTPLTAVADLDRAYVVANTENRHQIALAAGNAGLTGSFQEGISLYGGYDADDAWGRDVNVLPLISTDYNGWTLQNWTLDTAFHQVEFRAGNTSAAGSSSITLTIVDSDGITFVDALVRAGNAGTGTSGGNGSTGSPGTTGGTGGNSETENSGFFGACGGPHPQPAAGTGGASPGGSTTGGRGGQGGSNDGSRPQQEVGDDGVGPGGGGGAPAGGDDGEDGDPGLQGADGTPGAPGSERGTFSASGYVNADGGTGGLGGLGGGGGGGGGGDGGENTATCDTWGGSGGGGGGGGGGGTGATGGTGGGASAAVVLIGSTISFNGGTVQTGDGGDGGDGGQGGLGGIGGPGGSGGGGGDPLFFEAAGNGGDGGDGGQGGRGGHGGGAGGGPSIGFVCVSGGNLSASGVTYNLGSGGNGGQGPGSPGEDGRTAQTDGC